MYRHRFNDRQALRFKHFSRRSYALFSCIGREVLICTLSVATLTYAKADGISTKPTRCLSRVRVLRSLHCSRQRL